MSVIYGREPFKNCWTDRHASGGPKEPHVYMESRSLMQKGNFDWESGGLLWSI